MASAPSAAPPSLHASLASVAASNAPFCFTCGAILQLPDTNRITCDGCGTVTKFQDLPVLRVVTTSRPRPEPEWLKEYKGDRAKAQAGKIMATVEEECPKCRHNRMGFYTMQMRSVDEGQTVFYTCLKCGFQTSTDT